MKILSMTATFGKLEHETLTLKPSLNIIEAPNEWGKSTWCAFLVSMLYGIDTRERSTGTALAAKERYAPWSGTPMAGRMDILWNGKAITIERSTKGRLIFGEFRAYETETGIEVSELNATNCGQVLLGVERSVFTQAGFLRLADLPVVQNDALRRRLNNLVTTGDESGAGDKLGSQLKELKNKCRYNRTGLLPQAETEQMRLQSDLNELEYLAAQQENICQRQQELESSIAQLENHKKMLRYEASRADAQRVEAAEAALLHAKDALEQQRDASKALIPAADAQSKLQQASQMHSALLELKARPLHQEPTAPELSELYRDMEPSRIRTQAMEDTTQAQALENTRQSLSRIPVIGLIVASALLIGGFAAKFLLSLPSIILIIAGVLAIAIGAATLIIGGSASGKARKLQDELFARHPGVAPQRWIADGEMQASKLEQYRLALENYRSAMQTRHAEQAALEDRLHTLTDGETLQTCQAEWSRTVEAWAALEQAEKDILSQERHLQDLQALVKPAEKPDAPDELTHNEPETDSLLASARFEQRQLQLKLGQQQGRAEALGHETTLRTQLKAVNKKIAQLEDIYAALELAQNALFTATTQLQRRFAPRISKRAQALFAKLTSGRYQQLTLSQDLSVNARTEAEDTLRASQWRSDGTVDQLYLALRLAVAEELTPDAPLVLDDALVRFDDKRLTLAMDILKEAAEEKQVILFTCQGREAAMLD